MRELILTAIALFCFGTTSCFALGEKTEAKDVRKERMEIQKMKTKALNKVLKKDINREYEELTAAGWQSKNGENAFRTALENAWILKNEYGNDLYPRAFIADGIAVDKKYDAARKKAIAQAVNNLGDAVQKEMKLMLEFAEDEKKIKPQDTKVMRACLVGAMKQLVSAIQNIEVIMELSGAQGANNEVMVRVSVSGDTMVKNARAAIRAELHERGESYLADRVNIVLNWREATKFDKAKK